MSDKGQWGGPRNASGGKKIGRPSDPNRKRTVSISIPPEVREYLSSTGNISEAVADIVSRTKAFRDWRREKRPIEFGAD